MICIRSVKCIGQTRMLHDLLKRSVSPQIFNNFKNNKSTSSGTRETEDDSVNNEPIKYSTSPAATWLARHSRAPESVVPWYQSHVISLSLMIFLIYFCILREENDLDILLSESMPAHVYQSEDTNVQKTQQSMNK